MTKPSDSQDRFLSDFPAKIVLRAPNKVLDEAEESLQTDTDRLLDAGFIVGMVEPAVLKASKLVCDHVFRAITYHVLRVTMCFGGEDSISNGWRESFLFQSYDKVQTMCWSSMVTDRIHTT